MYEHRWCIQKYFFNYVRYLQYWKYNFNKWSTDTLTKGAKHYRDVAWAPRCLKLPTTPLFLQPLVQTCMKENIKDPRYWLFVMGIHRSRVYSAHKGSVTREIFPCHDALMNAVTNYGIPCRSLFKLHQHIIIIQHWECVSAIQNIFSVIFWNT